MTIKAFRDAFGFLAVVIPVAFGVAFLLVVGLLFRRERECAASAEAGRPELQPSRKPGKSLP